MTLVEVNVLLYAYNRDAPEQTQAEKWLTALFDSGNTVDSHLGFCANSDESEGMA